MRNLFVKPATLIGFDDASLRDAIRHNQRSYRRRRFRVWLMAGIWTALCLAAIAWVLFS